MRQGRRHEAQDGEDVAAGRQRSAHESAWGLRRRPGSILNTVTRISYVADHGGAILTSVTQSLHVMGAGYEVLVFKECLGVVSSSRKQPYLRHFCALEIRCAAKAILIECLERNRWFEKFSQFSHVHFCEFIRVFTYIFIFLIILIISKGSSTVSCCYRYTTPYGEVFGR